MINEGVTQNVAENVRAFRQTQGLTINQLARSAQVSPRTITKVEAGDNVTLATLLAIADGLEVSLTRLMFDGLVERTNGTIVVRHDTVDPLDLGTRIIRRLVQEEATQVMRLDHVEVGAGQSYREDGNGSGSSERILVLKGQLRCGPVAAPVELEPGDLAAYNAGRPHLYESLNGPVEFLLVRTRLQRDLTNHLD
jgi:transcriptional regulator with XRE-family HTH domain